MAKLGQLRGHDPSLLTTVGAERSRLTHSYRCEGRRVFYAGALHNWSNGQGCSRSLWKHPEPNCNNAVITGAYGGLSPRLPAEF